MEFPVPWPKELSLHHFFSGQWSYFDNELEQFQMALKLDTCKQRGEWLYRSVLETESSITFSLLFFPPAVNLLLGLRLNSANTSSFVLFAEAVQAEQQKSVLARKQSRQIALVVVGGGDGGNGEGGNCRGIEQERKKRERKTELKDMDNSVEIVEREGHGWRWKRVQRG